MVHRAIPRAVDVGELMMFPKGLVGEQIIGIELDLAQEACLIEGLVLRDLPEGLSLNRGQSAASRNPSPLGSQNRILGSENCSLVECLEFGLARQTKNPGYGMHKILAPAM